MIILLYTVHVLICFFLIAVVLLQQGKGADLSVFGGGATQTAFGARGAATVLHKMTVISFVLFIATTLAIGVVQSDRGTSDIFEDLDEEAATATTDGEAAEDAADEATEPEEDVQGALSAEPAADDAAAENAPAADADSVDAGTGDADTGDADSGDTESGSTDEG